MTDTPRIRTSEERFKESFRGCATHYCSNCYLWGTPINIHEKQCGNCNALALVNLEYFIKEVIDLERKRAEGLVEALEYYAHFFDSKEGRYRKEDMVNKPDFFIVNLPQVAEAAIAAYKQEPS